MLIEFMGKGKRRSSCDDEQALMKAAAWAWYQHGSGNEGNKPMRESDAATAPRQPRPSRYKLEAIAKAAAAARSDDAKSQLPGSSPGAQSPAHAENSLLDRYEIERITRHLDRLIVSGRGGDFSVRSARTRRKQYGSPPPPPPGRATPAKVGGFWIRHVVGLCGSRADVAEAGVLVGGRRPVPRVGR